MRTERLKRWLASVLATLDVLTDRRLMRDLRGGDLPDDPEAEAYWEDPANRHWARHSSVYDDRRGGC